ncbi:MAG: hypothetical protein ACKPKO_05950, partial [Candidatus Fonsibacter sp.]
KERSRNPRMMATMWSRLRATRRLCQDMDPKGTSQDKEPKHTDDGHKEKSPNGNKEACQDKASKDKDDGHKDDRTRQGTALASAR